jgi:hypothetical protein
MILFQFSILDSEEPLPGTLPGTGLQLSERALNGETRTYSRQTQPLAVPLRSSLLGTVQCLELSSERHAHWWLRPPGTLDDSSSFHPTAAIFARSRPAWAVIPPGLAIYDAMPPE